MHAHMPQHPCGHRVICENFFAPITRLSGIELRLSGLMAGAFVH